MLASPVMETGSPGVQHDDLILEIRRVLTALAESETRLECDRRSLAAWPGPEAIKRRFQKQLETRHARERGLLVLRLTELRQSTAMPSISGESRLTN
jgi:hypothetical protein